jgi:hypothetical protein
MARFAAVLDATPVPCTASRDAVKRSEVAGSDGSGFCAARTLCYWGFKLYLLSAPGGMPIPWCLAYPKVRVAEVCLGLLTIARRNPGLLAGLRSLTAHNRYDP